MAKRSKRTHCPYYALCALCTEKVGKEPRRVLKTPVFVSWGILWPQCFGEAHQHTSIQSLGALKLSSMVGNYIIHVFEQTSKFNFMLLASPQYIWLTTVFSLLGGGVAITSHKQFRQELFHEQYCDWNCVFVQFLASFPVLYLRKCYAQSLLEPPSQMMNIMLHDP